MTGPQSPSRERGDSTEEVRVPAVRMNDIHVFLPAIPNQTQNRLKIGATGQGHGKIRSASQGPGIVEQSAWGRGYGHSPATLSEPASQDGGVPLASCAPVISLYFEDMVHRRPSHRRFGITGVIIDHARGVR
jgi:hypothetical protein